MKNLMLPLLLGAGLASATLQAEPFSDKIRAAMQSDQRSEAHKQRDRNRKPVETLEFFGIKEDMRVLELVPGHGWYTRLLAPALREKGQYYAAISTKPLTDNLLHQPGYDKVKILSEASKWVYNAAEKDYDLPIINFDVKDLDAVLTFRNYHNFTKATRNDINEKSFAALKPGGIYGVVDHTRRHMQKDDNENGRRVDPLLVIKEVLAAGFEFVDYSELHYHPDDELRYEVGRKTVAGNTDRFTLLFRKPVR